MHDGAKMVDDRYLMTQEEYERYLKNAFKSLEPLKLEHFPVKEKAQACRADAYYSGVSDRAPLYGAAGQRSAR